MKRQLAVYWSAAFLHIAGWAIYYAVSRKLGLGTTLLLALATVETAPSILSIAASSIAARRGYRGLLSAGFIEALGLALFGLTEPSASLIAVLAASIGWAIAGPNILNVILESEFTSMKLGATLTSTALGWTIGGFAGPLLYEALGLPGTMAIAASMIASCYALLLVNLPSTATRPGGSRVGWLETLVYSLSLSPLIVATEVSFTLVMSRLGETIPTLHYSLVMGVTGATSAAGKLVAERLARRHAARVYRASMLAYAAWMATASMLEGYPLAILFTIPIYPFYELGFYTHVSRLLGERRATAAWSASYTLASLGVVTLALLEPPYAAALIASACLALVAAVATRLAEDWICERVRGERTGVEYCRASQSSW